MRCKEDVDALKGRYMHTKILISDELAAFYKNGKNRQIFLSNGQHPMKISIDQ